MIYGYGWEAGQSKQVVYRTADHHIHELYVTLGDNWRHADLTAITGDPAADRINNAYSWEAVRQSKQVVYSIYSEGFSSKHSRALCDVGEEVAARRLDRQSRGSYNL